MSVIKKLGAWVGFAYDVGRIIIGREWDDEPKQTGNAPTGSSTESIEPVVHVTPAAKSMLAQATTPKPHANPPPLDGSIEARLQGIDSR